MLGGHRYPGRFKGLTTLLGTRGDSLSGSLESGKLCHVSMVMTPLFQLQHARDSFLALTTDGINFIMNSQEICDVISQCPDPREAAQVIAEQVQAGQRGASRGRTSIHRHRVLCCRHSSTAPRITAPSWSCPLVPGASRRRPTPATHSAGASCRVAGGPEGQVGCWQTNVQYRHPQGLRGSALKNTLGNARGVACVSLFTALSGHTLWQCSLAGGCLSL